MYKKLQKTQAQVECKKLVYVNIMGNILLHQNYWGHVHILCNKSIYWLLQQAYNSINIWCFFSCIFLEARLWGLLYSVSVFAWAHWETQGRHPAARRCGFMPLWKRLWLLHIFHVDNVWDLWVYGQLQRFTINVLIAIIWDLKPSCAVYSIQHLLIVWIIFLFIL